MPAAARAGRRARTGQRNRGLVRQHAAFAIEIGRVQVDQLHEPLRERAKRLRRHTDATIDRRTRRRIELARNTRDRIAGDAGARDDRVESESRDCTQRLIEAADFSGVALEARRPPSLQFPEHADEEQRVAAGADENVLACDVGGLGAAWIDDDELAARGQRLQALADARRGHQAAHRCHRIGAEHQEVIGTVDVRNRQQELMPVHLRTDQLMRPLIDRRRGKHVRRAQCPKQRRQVCDMAEVMHVGIAEVHADRTCAMLALDRCKPLSRKREGLVPADLLPVAAVPPQRHPQPVGVGFQVEDRVALRTDVAAAEGIGIVAANRTQATAIEAELQAADRFAQRASAKTRFLGRHVDPPVLRLYAVVMARRGTCTARSPRRVAYHSDLQ